MADEQSIDEKIAEEREKMRAFGDEATRYFNDLSSQINSDFTGSLNQLISEELPRFTRQVEHTFSSLGLGAAGESVSSMVGDVLGSGMAGGNVFASALDAALTSALGGVIKTGKIDFNSVFKAGYLAGGRSLNKNLKLSRTQYSAGNAMELERSYRNL